jgi:hypothetical protein
MALRCFMKSEIDHIMGAVISLVGVRKVRE